MNVFERASLESDLLKSQISQIKSQLKHLPDGQLSIVLNGSNRKWFRLFKDKEKSKRNRVYLKKSETELARKLALKTFLLQKLKTAEENKRLLDRFLKQYKRDDRSAELLNNPDYYKLLKPLLDTQSETISEWMKEPFESNPGYPQDLVYPLADGRLVRTKSEVLIGNALLQHGIPFRYECILKVGTAAYYPDFTILHPLTYKLYYWEHIGALDKDNYIMRNISKLKDYLLNGIFPEDKLIMTFESPNSTLDLELVEYYIDHYFL